MNIPVLDLKPQYQSIKQEIDEAIQRVLDRQYFILGEEVEALEEEIATYCSCKYAVGVSSGTDALLASLLCIGIEPGDEVITTDYSFLSTASCIARLGAIPVFVDINPKTYNIAVERIEESITNYTRAILPVHFAGQMAHMNSIMEIANRNSLYVIEDSAQAFGATYASKKAGTIGYLGCVSFYPSKNLGGYGDSGMILTNGPMAYKEIKRIRNHGQEGKYNSLTLGGNFRMDEIQAAVLRVKLKHLDDWIKRRNIIALKYNELLKDTELTLPYELGCGCSTYHLYMIRAKKRDKLLYYMKEHGVQGAIYYPRPQHLQSCFDYLGYRKGDFPESERASRDTIGLPIYPEMTDEMVEYVAEVIKQGLGDKNV